MAEKFLSLQHLKEKRMVFFVLTFSRKCFSSVFLGDGLIIKGFFLFFPIRRLCLHFSFLLPLLSPPFSLLHFLCSTVFCFSLSVIWAPSALSPCLFLTKSDKRERLLVQQVPGRNLCLHFKVFGKYSFCRLCFIKHNIRLRNHDEYFFLLLNYIQVVIQCAYEVCAWNLLTKMFKGALLKNCRGHRYTAFREMNNFLT